MAHGVRRARPEDARHAGLLLHALNEEFGAPTPGPGPLATRLSDLLRDEEAVALLAGDGPDGVLVLRLRPSLWQPGLEAYLEELYVRPAARRRGFGGSLVKTAMELARDAGAVRMDVATGTDDRAARALYERLGFACDGDLFYGREL